MKDLPFTNEALVMSNFTENDSTNSGLCLTKPPEDGD